MPGVLEWDTRQLLLGEYLVDDDVEGRLWTVQNCKRCTVPGGEFEVTCERGSVEGGGNSRGSWEGDAGQLGAEMNASTEQSGLALVKIQKVRFSISQPIPAT